MPDEWVHRTRHRVEVDAQAGVVCGLIADAVHWPLFAPPNVHVERLECDGRDERLRMWATANDEVRSWISERTQNPRDLRVTFRRTRPQAPLRTMDGTWIVEQRPGGTSRLTLLHHFTAAGDRHDDVGWVERACDTDSRAELGSLKRLAERWARPDELVLSFEDAVRVNGPAAPVDDFLHRVADWPDPVPHVSRLDLTEDTPGVQVVSMDSVSADGSAHTRAAQPRLPAALLARAVGPAARAAASPHRAGPHDPFSGGAVPPNAPAERAPQTAVPVTRPPGRPPWPSCPPRRRRGLAQVVEDARRNRVQDYSRW